MSLSIAKALSAVEPSREEYDAGRQESQNKQRNVANVNEATLTDQDVLDSVLVRTNDARSSETPRSRYIRG